jgi:NAD(P)-dependent dehydrogenase (short-subunit alcohol dehydrogenase family)
MSQTILITGANRGIGHALALAFARADWTVHAAARHPDVPSLTAAANQHPNLHPIEIDVLDTATLARAAATLGDTPLDVLVNNAAIFPGDGDETLETLDLNWFAEAVETNVAGVARVTRAFLPHLRRATNARVVNISSGAASIGEKEDHAYYPYAISKAALNMLTRAMASEFKAEGITVTPISPGWVKTDMGGTNARITPEESAASLSRTIINLTLEDTGQFLDRDGHRDRYVW